MFNHFLEIGAALEVELSAYKDIIATDAVDNIKQHIIANGQVDTGDMLNSVAVTSSTLDEAEITVGVDYAGYQNYGTRYLPPRPFFEPGLTDTQGSMDDKLLVTIKGAGLL